MTDKKKPTRRRKAAPQPVEDAVMMPDQLPQGEQLALFLEGLAAKARTGEVSGLAYVTFDKTGMPALYGTQYISPWQVGTAAAYMQLQFGDAEHMRAAQARHQARAEAEAANIPASGMN